MEKREDFSISEEIIEWIGLKKSDYLSKLIGLLTVDDYGFEEFHLFNDKIPETIESPDKAFEDTADTLPIRTYIKSYPGDNLFYQIVIGALAHDDELNASVFIPILSFVSRKDELVKEFSIGNVIQRPTLN